MIIMMMICHYPISLPTIKTSPNAYITAVTISSDDSSDDDDNDDDEI